MSYKIYISSLKMDTAIGFRVANYPREEWYAKTVTAIRFSVAHYARED